MGSIVAEKLLDRMWRIGGTESTGSRLMSVRYRAGHQPARRALGCGGFSTLRAQRGFSRAFPYVLTNQHRPQSNPHRGRRASRTQPESQAFEHAAGGLVDVDVAWGVWDFNWQRTFMVVLSYAGDSTLSQPVFRLFRVTAPPESPEGVAH